MSPKTYFIAIMLIVFLSLAACNQSRSISSTPTEVFEPTSIPQYFDKIDYITFGGKIVNKDTGEWVNDRLVLVFLKGKEIARTTSVMRDMTIAKPPFEDEGWLSVPSFKDKIGSNGIEDGLFLVSVPNIYDLTLSTLGTSPQELSFFEGNTEITYADMEGGNVLASWLYPIYEGETREYFIPSKNITYTVKILPGNISQLPAEIQQRGSVRLLEGNRLVVVDPDAPEPTPQPAFTDNVTRFENVVEEPKNFPPAIFPINNCGGVADIKQEVAHTYLHEIIDETREKLGIEIPIFDWIKIAAEIEKHYGISDKQITTYSTTLTVPAGQNIQYTVIRKQIWESGTAIVVSSGVEVSAPYRILKSEIFEVSDSEQKTCP